MKDRRIRKIIITSDEAELPSEIREEIERNEIYRALHRRTQFTRRLVALKRYEVPEAGACVRCTQQLRQRIAWLEQQGGLDRGGEMGHAAWPGFRLRYALAAAAFAILAVNLFTLYRFPALDSAVSVSGVASRSLSDFLRATNESHRPSPFEVLPTMPEGLAPVAYPTSVHPATNPPALFLNQ